MTDKTPGQRVREEAGKTDNGDAPDLITDLRDQLARARDGRDRAMEDLDAVRTALGWDDPAWTEWLVIRKHPVPADLMRTTMVGQGPNLPRDVARLVAENERMRGRLTQALADLDAYKVAAKAARNREAAVTAERDRLREAARARETRLLELAAKWDRLAGPAVLPARELRAVLDATQP